MRAIQLIGFVVALIAVQPAYANYHICSDGIGGTYKLRQNLDPTVLVAMNCTAQQETADKAEVASDLSIISNTSKRSAWVQGPKFIDEPAENINALIMQVAQEYGHDPHLLKAIVRVESHFNKAAVSPKGALGLMQVMPATAERYGLVEPRIRLLNPLTNLRIGARYLSYLKKMFANRTDLVLAAYNSGEGSVIKYGSQIPPYPETQSYVKSVMKTYEVYKSR